MAAIQQLPSGSLKPAPAVPKTKIGLFSAAAFLRACQTLAIQGISSQRYSPSCKHSVLWRWAKDWGVSSSLVLRFPWSRPGSIATAGVNSRLRPKSAAVRPIFGPGILLLLWGITVTGRRQETLGRNSIGRAGSAGSMESMVTVPAQVGKQKVIAR